MKPITWCSDSLDRIRAFPEMARHKAGQQLNRVQQGFEPQDWKPMTGIWPGVCEIRIHQAGEYRVIYLARFAEAIYVLHAFNKKSRKTPGHDLEIATARFRALADMRRRLSP